MRQIAQGVAIALDAIAFGFQQRIEPLGDTGKLAWIAPAEQRRRAILDRDDLLLQPPYR